MSYPVLIGRPSSFVPETWTLICERLADGESLRGICRDEAMPARETVRRCIQENADLQGQYARARDEGLDALADLTLAEAEVATDDPASARLKWDARRWYLSKLAPKRYGDKLDVTTDGQKLEAPDPTTMAVRLSAIMLLGQQRLVEGPLQDNG